MKQIEVHIVERTSKKKYKNVEVYDMTDFHILSYGIIDESLKKIGLLGRLLPGFAEKLKTKVAVTFQHRFESRLEQNLNR